MPRPSVRTLTVGSSDSSATSYATASVSPGGNRLILVWVVNRKANTPDIPTVSGSIVAPNFEQVATFVYASTHRITLLRNMGSGPSPAALTIGFGGNTQLGCAWLVAESENVRVSLVGEVGDSGESAVAQYATGLATRTVELTFVDEVPEYPLNGVAVGWGTRYGDDVWDDTQSRMFGYESLSGTSISSVSGGSIFAFWRDSFDETPEVGHDGFATQMAGIAVELSAIPEWDPSPPDAATGLELVLYTDSGFYLKIDDASIYGVNERDFGAPVANLIFAESFGGYSDSLTALDYGNRDAQLGIHLMGDSFDNWVSSYRDILKAVLDSQDFWVSRGRKGARAYLSLRLEGQEHEVEFDILACPGISLSSSPTLLWGADKTPDVPLPLILRPWGRPQSVALEDIGMLSIGREHGHVDASPGDYATPVKVTLENRGGNEIGPLSTATDTTLRRVILGKKNHKGESDEGHFVPIFECESGTFTNYTSTPGAIAGISPATQNDGIASNGQAVRWSTIPNTSFNDSVFLAYSITDHLDNYYGTHRVFLYLRDVVFQASGAASIWLSYGGSAGNDIQNNEVVLVDETSYWLDLGTITIPHRFQPDDQPLSTFKFNLHIRGTDSTDDLTTLEVDCLTFIPVDDGFIDLEFDINLNTGAKAVLDDLQPTLQVYAIDENDDLSPAVATINSYVRFSVSPEATSGWYVLAMSTKANDVYIGRLSHVLRLSVEYFPHYALVR